MPEAVRATSTRRSTWRAWMRQRRMSIPRRPCVGEVEEEGHHAEQVPALPVGQLEVDRGQAEREDAERQVPPPAEEHAAEREHEQEDEEPEQQRPVHVCP